MKKLINDPARYVDEMLAGLVLANPALTLDTTHPRVVRRSSALREGKVGVVSGGGSGHLPLFAGYVGDGLLDACAVGNVFEGPNLASCEAAIRAGDGGAGVLLLYGNYGGDRMNFDMASDLVADDGIETVTVLGMDDIASAGPDESDRRRGVAGLVFAYKAAGAKAEAGGRLNDVASVARRAVERTRTIGLALQPCRTPGATAPTFQLADNEVEMGIGIHGEPGIWRDRLRGADSLVDEMIERLLAERPSDSGRIAILVNGLGATPLEELFILYRRASEALGEAGIEIVRPLIGPYATALEMAGASISLCFMDPELETLLAAPAECPFWRVS